LPLLFFFQINAGALARITGGQTYYYPSFASQRDGDKFVADLRHNLTRETAWEAVMRVRSTKGKAPHCRVLVIDHCHTGVKVAAHYGNFAIRSTDLMALPAVDTDKGTMHANVTVFPRPNI